MLATGSPTPSFDSLLLVAGAGGGSGGSENCEGGDGGNAGSAGGAGMVTDGGCGVQGSGGGPGTSTAGGTAGSGSGTPGPDGSFGIGGSGGNGPSAGGGGGGGYYGGGGGGAGDGAGGGGGGSSFVEPGATNVTEPTLTSVAPMVSITYDVPTAHESAASLSFGNQPQGTAGTEQTFSVTNNGSAPLIVSGLVLGGSDPGDYLVDDGCQLQVAPGSSCNVGVRFGPQAQGASSATLTLLTNAATAPPAVSLSGRGGPLPQGPAGQQGATGAQGPAGQVELITCKTVTKKVKGHSRKVQRCTGKLVSGTVKFTTTGAVVHATLSRRGVVYASGASVPVAGVGALLVLNDTRHLPRGSYLLTLRSRHGHRWVTDRVHITVG